MKSTTKIVSSVLALGSSLVVAAALAATAVPQISATATDKGYSIPAQVTGGTVRLSLKNTGTTPHGVEIFKLKTGVTSAALKKAVADFALKGDEAAAPMVAAAEFYGGVPDVAPKGQGDVTVTLEPGEYALVSTTTNGDEKNPQANVNLGLFQPFTVAGGQKVATPADYQVKLADFAIALPTGSIAPGKHSWEVVNSGRQPHFLFVARVQAGKTADDVMKFLMAGPAAQGEPPVEFLNGVGSQVLSPGKSNILDFDLKPGNYFVACFVGDPQTQMPHAMLGMTHFFTVNAK